MQSEVEMVQFRCELEPRKTGKTKDQTDIMYIFPRIRDSKVLES